MKIGIIGAGFTGLAAGYYLQQEGHEITIFEKDDQPGGLAIGYQEKGWKWSLEKHYHHWFTNDKDVLTLAKEIDYPVIIARPKTSSFVSGGIYQLDSPLTLLKFPKLSFIDRFRTAATLAPLRFNPFWKPLEKFRAVPYLKTFMGSTAYKTVWEPLMVNKLGKYANDVSLAWFWARIYKRTPSLAYPEKGFLAFANRLAEIIMTKNGKIHFSTEIVSLTNTENGAEIAYKQNTKLKKESFDRIIVTTPAFLFAKIAPQLPKDYVSSLNKLKGIGAVNMVLRLKKPFFTDQTYWLNICEAEAPVLAVVEHTNFMESKYYNNEHLVYVGNYMETDHPYFSMSKEQLLKTYDSLLTELNPEYKKNLIDYEVFHAPFAQPIIPPLYSQQVPSMVTPLAHVFLANMQQVYPWDRGTNYAVQLGKKVANLVTEYA